MSTTKRGRQGEAFAAQMLEIKGYKIIEQNWRCNYGELDIIAYKDAVWVFVEVKTRRGDDYGEPEEAVDQTKRERLLNASQFYLSEHDIADPEWRVDVVAITLADSGKVFSIRHHEDAVRGGDG